MNNFEYLSMINPAIVKHEDKGYLLYIPANYDLHQSIYLIITEKLLPDYNGKEVSKFFSEENNQDILVLGEDYLISSTLSQVMEEVDENFVIEDLVDEDLNITDKFEMINSTISTIQRYYKLNILKQSSYSEEDIINFASTFATIILDYAEVQNTTTIWNTIYMHVLQWLQNSQNDTAMTLMNLIFSGKVTVQNQTLSNCGCTKNVDGTSLNNVSCYDMYIEALRSWVATMFGDLNFYYDWFFVSTGDETNEPNEEMIDMLIAIIEELKKLNLTMKNENSGLHNCGCIDKTLDVSYIGVLDNYIKVLNFVKNCKIEENKNKIQTWGKEFGQILPNLIFS